MDFIDEIKLFSKRVEVLKSQIQTEEATKTSLIMPFFRILGYDVFNPMEFVPEFIADVGIKKGEKVDYAILEEGKPVILIEAKWCGDSLDRHANQLLRYFGTTKAKFGILTNGIEYRFYTDLDEPNKMDEEPFFVFNMLDLREQGIAELKKFHKTTFDLGKVCSTAEYLKYTNQVKQLFSKQMENPSDTFINYILGDIYQGRKTQNVVDKFKGIIKKSFNEFINDMLNDRFKAAITPVEKVENEIGSENDSNSETMPTPVTSKINTTQEELEGFALVKMILKETVPLEKITYKDTESYFGILYENNSWKWICRLQVETAKKFLILPCEEKTKRIPINSINDLFDYAAELKESVARYTHPTKQSQQTTAQ